MEEKLIKSTRATITLYEGVLNDDRMEVLKPNLCYGGHNRATCRIVYYTFANEWANHEHARYFQTIEKAIEWYEKQFSDRVIAQGTEWLREDGEDYTLMEHTEEEQKKIDDLAKNEWEAMTLYCELD